MTVMPPAASPGRTDRLWNDLALLEVDFEQMSGESGHAHWVDAAPFRAHLRQLITETRLPWRTVAMLAEVPAAGVEVLLRGRGGRPVGRIHPLLASRLLQVTSRSIADAARQQVGAAETSALLQRLAERGWDSREVARRTGLLPGQLDALLGARSESVSRLAEATIRAAAQVLLRSVPAAVTSGGTGSGDRIGARIGARAAA